MSCSPIRRASRLVLLLGVALLCGSRPSLAFQVRPVEVLVLSSAQIPAYTEASAAIQNRLRSKGVPCLILNEWTKESLASALGRKPAALVAVGSRAFAEAVASPYAGPIFPTMIMRATLDASPDSRVAGAVVLDLDPVRILQSLQALLPQRRRIALIAGPSLDRRLLPALRREASRLALEIQVLDCDSPKQVLDQVAALDGKADLIWCLPDRILYPGPVQSTLILQGLRMRIPVVGYSEGVVKAGALIGFFPDYADVAEQTAELVWDEIAHIRHPRLLLPRQPLIAVNERAIRLLGIQIASSAAGVQYVR